MTLIQLNANSFLVTRRRKRWRISFNLEKKNLFKIIKKKEENNNQNIKKYIKKKFTLMTQSIFV
jgi:hypothetical protein